jgi:ABC-2 type transport system ATP-binding protein
MRTISRETAGVLSVRQLGKVYGGSRDAALNGLEFTVVPGEIFGLLGPNGAGKTTAIAIMSTMLRPSGGQVLIFGHDVVKQPKQARRLFGVVPQEIALYAEMTAHENLSFFGRLYGLSGPYLAERISVCLELVGLEQRGHQRLSTFSGGMKRRVNLAAAILHQPPLLFLDEPTVGIDAQSRQLILEKLLLLQQQGTTMLYTTHYLEEAEQLCSRVAIIDRGTKIAEGAPAELMKKQSCATLQEVFFGLTGRTLRD